MKHIFCLSIVIILSGCASLSPQEIRANIANVCEEIGFAKDTPEFSNCMLQLIVSHDEGVARRKAAVGAAILNGQIINPPFRNY